MEAGAVQGRANHFIPNRINLQYQINLPLQGVVTYRFFKNSIECGLDYMVLLRSSCYKGTATKADHIFDTLRKV